MHLFAELARRTGAVVETGWSRSAVSRALARAGAGRWPWSRRPIVATTELLTLDALPLLDRLGRAAVLDVHDHPLLQRQALGAATTPDEAAALGRRYAENLARFELLVVPSLSFGQLAGIEAARQIVAPNGTDADHIRPRPFPERPVVGLVSGAAPGRGIEHLIAAVELVRASIPELELCLWLAAERNDPYLASLRAATANRSWIKIERASYEDLPDALARATVLTVPHPPGDYMDSALPVKLFDSMAAGRPVVVTPRREMAAVVRAHGAGLVAAGDRVEDFADALLVVLQDSALARQLGAAARRAAESHYDWRIIGARLADTVLARTR